MTDRVPTMKHVAARAGVALKTVSRYVNGATNIHPDLAARIADAIAELDYRHNLAAASIRPGRSGRVVGLITNDLANPYYSAIARAAERVLADAGYLLVTASSEESPERNDRLVDRLVAQRVDALVVVPPRGDTGRWARTASGLLPVVALDRRATGADLHTLVADDAGGAALGTSALVEAGARRIAFLGDDLGIPTIGDRFAGYRRALERAGVAADDGLVRAGARTSAEAAAATRRLLEQGDADAIFAANNRASVGAVQAFADAGARLPLVGFDDFESATLVRPAVSVVAHDVAELGRLTAETVLALLDGSAGAPAVRTLPASLVLRGSERSAA